MLSRRAIVIHPTLFHRDHSITKMTEPYALRIFPNPRIIPNTVSFYHKAQEEHSTDGHSMHSSLLVILTMIDGDSEAELWPKVDLKIVMEVMTMNQERSMIRCGNFDLVLDNLSGQSFFEGLNRIKDFFWTQHEDVCVRICR